MDGVKKKNIIYGSMNNQEIIMFFRICNFLFLWNNLKDVPINAQETVIMNILYNKVFVKTFQQYYSNFL